MYVIKRVIAVLLGTLCIIGLVMRDVSAQQAVQVSSSAGSAVLMEASSGRVLFEQNAHVRRPMASTTKLMTALLAAECLAQEAVLTATAQALNVEGSSMGLAVGDTLSRDDLLYGLLLASGNDAANVVALSVDDSYDAFAARMNARAAALGMANTYFVTPSGLDADGHGAAAYDMALLARAVLENELLAMICATQEAIIHIGDRTVSLSNHNRLLAEYEGAVGMKTGYTSKAGRCLVSAATRNGVTLIAVTLDCANDWEEHKALLDAGFSCLSAVSLTPTIPVQTAVFGGEETAVPLTVQPRTITLMNGDEQQLEIDVQYPAYVWAPLSEGEEIGRVTYRLRGACVAVLPVTAEKSIGQVERDSFGSRFWRCFCKMFKQMLI